MKALATALFVLMLGGAAFASDDRLCALAEHLVTADFATERVAAAIAAKKFKIVVIGTNSSIIATPTGRAKAYPTRLEEALTKRLPGVAVAVTTVAHSKFTAIDSEKRCEKLCGQYATTAISIAIPNKFLTANPMKRTGSCGEAFPRNPRPTSATSVATKPGAAICTPARKIPAAACSRPLAAANVASVVPGGRYAKLLATARNNQW